MAGKIYSDENITVSAIPTDHIGGAPTYAYVIEAEGKKLLFTGDLSGDFHDYPTIVFEEDFDAVVSEFTHFRLDTCVPKMINSRTKQMIFTHVAWYNIDEINTVTDQFPFPFYIAQDGNIYEI